METFVLQAEQRNAVGRAENKRLRRAGYLPAVVYGGHGEAVNIQIEHNAMLRNLEKSGFYSNILDLSLDLVHDPIRDIRGRIVRSDRCLKEFCEIRIPSQPVCKILV